MSRFVTGKELEDAIADVVYNAKENLLIVSPFIKLDDHFKNLIDTHSNNPDIRITVLFGKNEERPSRSMSASDIGYFKKFHNVTVVYVPALHAKYYGNERQGVITSLNLYDYSLKNNIEFGVFSEVKFVLDDVAALLGKKNSDTDAFEYSMRVAHTHDVIYARRPRFQKNLADKLTNFLTAGVAKSRHFVNSEVVLDHTDALLRGRQYPEVRLADLQSELDFAKTDQVGRPEREPETVRPQRPTGGYVESMPVSSARQPYQEKTFRPNQGYCIRTRESISFNPERPFSYAAWKKWADFGNPDYPEKYCHLTGRPSNGRTSMRNPILNDN